MPPPIRLKHRLHELRPRFRRYGAALVAGLFAAIVTGCVGHSYNSSSTSAFVAPAPLETLPAAIIGNSVASDHIQTCKPGQIGGSIAISERQTSAGVVVSFSTTLRENGSVQCALPTLDTCGIYGGISVSRADRLVWQWIPVGLGRTCDPTVLQALPVTIISPPWRPPQASARLGYSISSQLPDDGSIARSLTISG